MQAIPVQIIAPQAMTDALVTYYTSPANKKTMVSKVTLTNVGASAQAVDLHLVPSGGTAGVTNKILSAKVIDADEAFPAYQLESLIMDAGDFIQAKINTAASTDIVIVGAGVEIF